MIKLRFHTVSRFFSFTVVLFVIFNLYVLIFPPSSATSSLSAGERISGGRWAAWSVGKHNKTTMNASFYSPFKDIWKLSHLGILFQSHYNLPQLQKSINFWKRLCLRRLLIEDVKILHVMLQLSKQWSSHSQMRCVRAHEFPECTEWQQILI